MDYSILEANPAGPEFSPASTYDLRGGLHLEGFDFIPVLSIRAKRIRELFMYSLGAHVRPIQTPALL